MADRCPLCGSLKCELHDAAAGRTVKCKTYQADFRIRRDMTERYAGEALYPRLLNLMAEKLLREPAERSGADWTFYYDPLEETRPEDPAQVNLAYLMPGYPSEITEKVNRVLLNLAARYPAYGVSFGVDTTVLRLYFPSLPAEDSTEADGILLMLADFGYVHRSGRSNSFFITAAGWKKVEELQKKSAESRQGFIAMYYLPETEGIREAFRRGMQAAGYVACIIDEKEHNNQIVPEIFHEIRRSKFVVADITYPNFGAYYEAGYAQGLGKEVIVCCRRAVFDNRDGQSVRPHFDISQKSMVIWDDEEDLVRRLKRRIEATVQ